MTLKTRKIALTAAIAVLLVVYIIQVALSNRSTEKTFGLKGDVTQLSVESVVSDGSAMLSLQKKDGNWVAGKKEFLASNEDVEEMIKNLKELRAISTVSRITNEATDERYGFSGPECFNVVVKNGEKTIRCVTIGKASPTGEQYYFKVDSGNEVYLSAKNIKDFFFMTDDEIREISIYKFESDKIDEITLSNNSGVLKLNRDTSKKDNPWTSENQIPENFMLSQTKVNNLVSRLRTIQVEEWNDGKDEFSPDAILNIKCGEKSVTVQSGKIGENNIAVSSDFDDSFVLSTRTLNALATKLEDLLEEKSIVEETQNLN